MRLKQIELSGFRGSKNLTTVPFGTGFTIITGRNGSGKSSICDGLEYVLTRRLSRFGPADVEGGERGDDYIWWRDGSPPSNRQVKVIFDLDDGTTGERVATPNELRSSFEDRLFYDNRSYISDPLALLSQTMLIRDESIVKFSTDLPEADRFDLFYKAIGLTDLVRIEKRANALVQQLKRKTDDLEREYRIHRETVGQVISEISEARTAAAQLTTSDIATTQRALAALAGLPSNMSLTQLAVKVSQILTEQKGRVQLLERLNTDISKSLSWREQLQTLEAKCEAVKREMDATESALKTAAESRIAMGEKLRMAQVRTPDLAALAQLREHGLRINLQDGHCPLCGSAVSKPDFEAHLKHIQNEIERQNKTLGELTAQEESSRIDYEKRRNEFQSKSIEYSRAMSDCETLKTAMAQLQSEAASLGVKLELASVESELQETRKRVSELQSGLLQLEGSSAFDRIADLERQRNFAQTEVERITRQIDSLSQAIQNAKNAADTTKRVSWESVDDCLAALSPLLSELFMRLKPHIDYSEVRYHMRGDVKRFLSFEIGNGINPRFTFSSGQRRALGIAFLLAVHLSRPWCKLPTLVLDDPVQHIDDYRALHFAEVLSSVRQTGHQIICTVQDSALADLLCRRLRSANLGDGLRIEMEYEPGLGARVKEVREVGPLPDKVLMFA
jgi:DNA repair exonuclease SbcCD ATPase subunit